MPIPQSAFSEIVTTTLRKHTKEIADAVTNHNAFLRYMRDRGRVMPLDGGYEVQVGVAYQENGTYQRYSGYEQLSINASDVLTSAKFDLYQAAVHVTASGREMRQNMGEAQVLNLVRERIKVATSTISNQQSIDLYSDGTLANQIGGLAFLFQTNGQGTVGGIDSATWANWRNQFREMTGTNAFSKSTILGEFNGLNINCIRGNERPNLYIASNDIWLTFTAALQDLQRITPENGATGFQTVSYNGNPVVFDSNSNFTTTAERAYFLNTDTLWMYEHPDAKWTAEPQRVSINQDAVVIPMYWMGTLVTNNRRLNGILIDAS